MDSGNQTKDADINLSAASALFLIFGVVGIMVFSALPIFYVPGSPHWLFLSPKVVLMSACITAFVRGVAILRRENPGS